MIGRIAAATLLSLASCVEGAKPEAEETQPYLYYFHGKVVEDFGPRGVNPRWGAYDYPGIIAALEKEGVEVVSEIRPKDTDPSAYADKIVADIQSRIRSGVSPSRITVAGASKGSVIAALVSSRLKNPLVRYVLLANCNQWLIREMNPRLTGELLSIYEGSDEIGGSCKPVVDRSPDIKRFSEIRLETGLGHGMLYRPLPEWVKPAASWAKR